MTGSETAPSAVKRAHLPDLVEHMLLGPLAQQFLVQQTTPFAKDSIKAIWRNEIGDAT